MKVVRRGLAEPVIWLAAGFAVVALALARLAGRIKGEAR